jgi:putative ABC transport system ATP-binding protein
MLLVRCGLYVKYETGARRSEMTAKREIELRHLSKSFTEGRRQHLVLDDVSAGFRRGETIAVRGRSGSGKSTLLNLIAGIDTPDAGRVIVADIDLTGLTERDRTLFRREHIGFVYQAFNLVPTLNVADNIRLVLELNRLPARESQQRIEELLAAVGLADRADSYPDVLSGGEQQRVAIARALCHDPAVVIADEPTGNLDDSTAEVVLELLDRLVRERGGTMLIATHSARVSSVCDREVEIHGGKLEAASAALESQ